MMMSKQQDWMLVLMLPCLEDNFLSSLVLPYSGEGHFGNAFFLLDFLLQAAQRKAQETEGFLLCL